MTWYHGTRRGFQQGGVVLPADIHGGEVRPGHRGDNSTSWVYITDDLELAWWYAENTPESRGKPKVLVVQPFGVVERDNSPFDYEWNQYRCEWAKVLKVIRRGA